MMNRMGLAAVLFLLAIAGASAQGLDLTHSYTRQVYTPASYFNAQGGLDLAPGVNVIVFSTIAEQAYPWPTQGLDFAGHYATVSLRSQGPLDLAS